MKKLGRLRAQCDARASTPERRREVRERRQERLVVAVHAVAEQVVRRDVEAGVNGVAAGQRAQLDVDDVVAEPAAVREAVESDRRARRGGLGDAVGGIAMLSRSISAGRTCVGWLSPAMPVRKIATRSLRGAGGTLITPDRARDQPGRLRIEHERSELRVVRRLGRVERVLLARAG